MADDELIKIFSQLPTSEGSRYVPRGVLTCYHEAGHAVMHHLERVYVKSVHWTPMSKRQKGYVVTGIDTSTVTAEYQARSYALGTAGGEAAERIVAEVPDDMFMSGYGYSSDWRKAFSLLRRFRDDNEEIARDWLALRRIAQVRLSTPPVWHAVEMVAWRLFDRHRLGKRETKSIIEGAMQGFTPDSAREKTWWL